MSSNNLRTISVPFTTDASGDAEVDTPRINGIVRKVIAVRSGLAGTATLDIDTVEDVPEKIVDLAAGNTDVTLRPQLAATTIAGAAISGEYVGATVSQVKLRITVAAGGNTLSGSVSLTIEEFQPALL